MPRRSTLRASDQDRDLVAERLRQAAAEGRLLAEEFEHRLARALRARTYAELDPLVADLPSERRAVARRLPRSPVAVAGVALVATVALALAALAVVALAGLMLAWGVWMAVAWLLLSRGRHAGRRYGTRHYRGRRYSGRGSFGRYAVRCATRGAVRYAQRRTLL